MYKNPAQLVIETFGGVHMAAKAIGRSPASVCNWQKTRKWKGSQGSIPVSAQKDILKVAGKLGLDLTLEDLNFGRTIRMRKKRATTQVSK